MAVAPSRVIARKTLTDVRSRRSYVSQALSRVLRDGDYHAQDIGYGTRLAHLSVGTCRAVREILDLYLPNAADLAPIALDALVVSATELLYLNAPAHIVDQGVALMKKTNYGLAGLANAVLRQIATQRDDIRATNLAFEFGFPPWLAEQLVGEYGEDVAREVMSVSNEEAPIFGYVLSVAPDDWAEQLTKAGAQITPMGEQTIMIEHMRLIREHPLITSRMILVTDLGAQIALSLAPIGARMLEIGCGRGTKSLMWADRARRAQEDTTLVGVDNNVRKIERAQGEAHALGFDEIIYRVADATDAKSLGDELYDVVFVDAPCSGLGTLRRHSDKRMTLEPGDITQLRDLSARILHTSARSVAKGGILLYATCTISRRENDAVVLGFLASEQGTGFHLDRIRANELPPMIAEAKTHEGLVQMLPRSGGGDGHFIARLVRE